MSRTALVATAAGALLFAGASLAVGLATNRHGGNLARRSPSLYRGSAPPPGIRAPDFPRRDFRGREVTMSRLRGFVVLLSFVDSKCTQSCPIVAGIVARAMQQLPPADRRRVVPLLMSVNPNLDTPVSVHRFLARRRALSLSYLIGTVRRMRPIWKAYGVLAAVDTGNADVHSSDVRVFDRNGIWVSTQHVAVDLTVANLKHDAKLALRRTFR